MTEKTSDPAAAAPRRPTADANRFLIPEGQLPSGLAARLEAGGPAAVPSPAATVVLVREGEAGPEVLLLLRPRRASFAGAAWVFPGGRVDAEDADVARSRRLTGPPLEAWGRNLGIDPVEAGASVVAALREAWEETGILLGQSAASEEELGAARAELLSGAAAFPELLERHEVRLDGAAVTYLAHWITPEPEPRRFDTRFFLARVPSGAECELRGDELVRARWITPKAAFAEFGAGELRLLPPTAHTLQRLSAYRSVPEMWSALADAPVPTILPRMRAVPEGIVIEI